MDLLDGLMINCRIVSRVFGIVINISMIPALAIFLIKFIFQVFGKLLSCYKFMDLYEAVTLEIGILDSLLRQ